jgi:hypothetical protein
MYASISCTQHEIGVPPRQLLTGFCQTSGVSSVIKAPGEMVTLKLLVSSQFSKVPEWL